MAFSARSTAFDCTNLRPSGAAGLWAQGLPIGVNDLHIAAHARSEGLTLVSNNLREFERVDGLLLENWVDAS